METARTSDDLKYKRCVENWFDLTVTFGKDESQMPVFGSLETPRFKSLKYERKNVKRMSLLQLLFDENIKL